MAVDFDYLRVNPSTVRVQTGASSVTIGIPPNSDNNPARLVRLLCETGTCYVNFGSTALNATCTTTTSVPYSFTITAGAIGATVLSTASTTNLANGMVIAGPGIPTGTTVVSFVANTSITISRPLTAAYTATASAYIAYATPSGLLVTSNEPTIISVDGLTFISYMNSSFGACYLNICAVDF